MIHEVKKRNKYLKKDLQARGWTDALIKQFYPVPEETRRNPRYYGASPMKLYDPKKVRKIERTRKFREASAIAGKRRETASSAADRKRTATAEWVERLPTPSIPAYTLQKLTALAVAAYNSLWSDRDPDKHASVNDDRDFLDRLCVNFLRHECTNYETRLLETRGKVGASEARLEIRNKVLDAISEEYPLLTAECGRQEARAYDSEFYRQLDR